LRRDNRINIFLREQRDEAGLRALRAARDQNRRAVKSKTARDRHEMTERTFVTGHGRGGGKFSKSSGRVQFNSLFIGKEIRPTSSATSSLPTNGHAFCASIPIFGAPTVNVTAASIAAPKCGSPVSAFKPDGTSTASTGIFDSLTVAINFFQPSSSGRFKPTPNKPSMMSAGFCAATPALRVLGKSFPARLAISRRPEELLFGRQKISAQRGRRRRCGLCRQKLFKLSPNRHTFVAGLKLCDEFARVMLPP
jgi:hypothetical protein